MRLFFTSLFVIISLASTSAQQILEGTWSYRTGQDGSVSDPLKMGVTDYYNMTNWDSSPYKQFRYHSGSNTPSASNFKMNFRLLFPNNYDQAKSKKYPMVILLHGLGEGGIRGSDKKFPAYDKEESEYLNNDYSLFNGGRVHLEAVNTNPSDPRAFPGFVFIPQNEKSWNSAFVANGIAIIEELLKKYNIDPNRVYLHGLSDGARGVWKMADARPDLFAAILPMSWVQSNVDINNFLYLPIWHFQGELDQYPQAKWARDFQDELKAAGAITRYTEYPNAGHGIWDRAYAEPDFFSWMLGKSKTDIYALYGKTSVCPDDEVNVKLGISAGFMAYQWRKKINGEMTTFDPGTTNNEFTATEYGDYYVRFSRIADPQESDWTDWSKPKTIKMASRPVAPNITAQGSTTLPTPEGKTTVDLMVPENYESYNWLRNGIPLTGKNYNNNAITISDKGSYTIKIKEIDGCISNPSAPVKVTVTAPDNELASPDGLAGQGHSGTEIDLTWVDKADNETGYEIYRSGHSAGGYTFIAKVGADEIQFRDQNLNPETDYYYIVVAVNDAASSSPSNEAKVTTLPDLTPPSSPANLSYDLLSTKSVRLTWLSATDEAGVKNYDIFANNEFILNTSDTTLVVSDLVSEKLYNFTVKARDLAGNVSEPSNQVTVVTQVEGLTYKYYFGDFWDFVADYQSWEVSKTGKIANFNINIEEEGGVRPNEQINYFAFDFDGYIFIENSGNYKFSLKSSAGSILKIDNKVIVNNDGIHEAITKTSNNISLTAGPHTIKVQFFDNIEEEVLEVGYSGPDTGNEMVPIPDEALKSGNFEYPPPPMAPGDLTTDNWNFTQINLTWVDNSSDETGFEIYRSMYKEGPYRVIKTTVPGVVSFEDTDLAPNQGYYYRVKAISYSGSSDFISAESGTWLSVVLQYFDCKNDNKNIALNWATEREVDNAGFTIERSADNIHFEPLDTIAGAGNSSQLINYEYFDTSPLKGNNYYRLRQSDIFDNFGYSDLDSVFYGGVNELDARIYPVPAQKGGTLTVETDLLNYDNPVLLQIMDGTGRVYYQESVEPEKLKNPYRINIMHWAKGIYIFNLAQGKNNTAKRFVID